MRRVLALVAVSVGLLAVPGAAFALPAGSLDPSFGTDGNVRSDIFPTGQELPVAAAMDSQGRVVVAGQWGPGCPCSGDVFVARYKPNGSLDETFDGDGIESLTSGGGLTTTGVAIQSSGRILVSYTDAIDTFVLGLKPTGATDTAFGTAGTATVAGAGEPGALALDGDKVAVAGTVPGADTDFGLERLTANGGTDPSFNGGNGLVPVDVDAGSDDLVGDVAAAPGGKIVVTGIVETARNDFAVVQFDSAGVPDTSYDGDGIQTIDVGVDIDDTFQPQVAVQSDGRVIVAGAAGGAPPDDVFVARLMPDGSAPDPAFSTDGIQNAGAGVFDDAGATSLLLQPDGKILVGGHRGLLFESSFVYRYKSDGELDPTFSDDGKAAINLGDGAISSVDALVAAPDNRVVAVSEFWSPIASPPDDDRETRLTRLLTLADNCPSVSNPDQADLDGDGQGDPCDDDIDGDGLSNAVEAAIGSNPRGLDSDGDGKPDGVDACPVMAGTLDNGCPAPAAPPAGDGGSGSGLPVLDRTAPKVGLTGPASKLARKAFFKSGLSFTVAFDEPCTALVELIGTLKHGVHVARAGDVVLAAKVLKQGSGSKVTLKLGTAQKKLIGKAAKLTLRISAFDRAGNPTVVKRTIRVK